MNAPALAESPSVTGAGLQTGAVAEFGSGRGKSPAHGLNRSTGVSCSAPDKVQAAPESAEDNLLAGEAADKLRVPVKMLVEWARLGVIRYWKLPDGKPPDAKNLRFKGRYITEFEGNFEVIRATATRPPARDVFLRFRNCQGKVAA